MTPRKESRTILISRWYKSLLVNAVVKAGAFTLLVKQSATVKKYFFITS
jgi:hypothetical protein